MDPGACDGQTTVCPLWLLAHAFTGLHFGGSTLQTGAVEFPAFELLRVDTIQAAHIEHDYLLPAGSLAIGIRLDAAGLAERVMNRALVELVVRQPICCQYRATLLSRINQLSIFILPNNDP